MKKIFYLSLVVALNACGYVETTGTQRDYVSDRDECRGFAESNINIESAQSADNKNKLLAAFAGCMKKRGWAVSGPDDKPREEPPIETARKVVIAPAPTVVVPAPKVIVESGSGQLMSREAQCTYARHARKHSTIASELAKDCDGECKLSPGSAACAGFTR